MSHVRCFHIVASRIHASRNDSCVAPFTWLILPRGQISHACLSKNLYIVTLRMGLKNSDCLFDDTHEMDPVVILELIHAYRPDS